MIDQSDHLGVTQFLSNDWDGFTFLFCFLVLHKITK